MILYKDKKRVTIQHPYGNILLLGLSGSGKSSVAPELARNLGLGYLDLDDLIEKQHKMSIKDIFAKHGEEYFRQQESRMLQDLQGVRSQVIALGASALRDEQNWQLGQKLGLTVWLDSPLSTIIRRLDNSAELTKRPLLADLSDSDNRTQQLQQRLKSQLRTNIDHYRKCNIGYREGFASCAEQAWLLCVRIGETELQRKRPRWRKQAQ